MIDNYNKIIEKVASSCGLSKEEIDRKVEAKRAKLSGLISREGALQVIAAELGVNFDNEKFKIDELLPGMRKVNVSGKIVRLFPVRSFTSKSGQEGKVLNFILADNSANIRVVLWDTKHIELIESKTLTEGHSVEIFNASIREGEIHLGSFSQFKKSNEVFDDVSLDKKSSIKPIVEFNINDSASVRAFIVQSFDPRFFNVCPECKKKVVSDGNHFNCDAHGKILPEKRALINVVIDDGTESMRAVLFHENLAVLGITAYEDQDLLLMQKQNILGQEFIFSGEVRNNKFFNNTEFIINKVEKVDLDKLLSELEVKSN